MYTNSTTYYTTNLTSNSITLTYISPNNHLSSTMEINYYDKNQLKVLNDSFLYYANNNFLKEQAQALSKVININNFTWNQVYSINTSYTTLYNTYQLTQYLQFKLLNENVSQNSNKTFNFSLTMICLIGLKQQDTANNLTGYMNYFITTFTYNWNDFTVNVNTNNLLLNAKSVTDVIHTNALANKITTSYSGAILQNFYNKWIGLGYFTNTDYTTKPITTLNKQIRSKIGYLSFAPTTNDTFNDISLTPIII